MQEATTTSPVDGAANDPGITTFYGEILQALEASNIPFLVGGAYAFHRYTGIGRDTKDLDIFVRRQDYDHICAVLMQAGYDTELQSCDRGKSIGLTGKNLPGRGNDLVQGLRDGARTL
jgi:hypothetical protein